MCLSEWREFPSAPSIAGKNLMTARVSILKSRAFLTCFRACFLPGRAKNLAPGTMYSTQSKFQSSSIRHDHHGFQN